MKPISKGKEGDNYTLYYPLYISDNIFKINLDKILLVNTIYKILPEKVKIEILPRTDVTILRISNIETLDDARKICNILQKYFITLAINKSITIYIDWELLEPKPLPFQFFSSWPEAKKKGWDTGEDENFNVDGAVDITRPCIVPESQKILDQDVLIGRPGSRNISKEELINSIVEEPLPQLNDRHKLALNALLTSFSLTDQRLAYLLILICLEISAEDHYRERDGLEKPKKMKLLFRLFYCFVKREKLKIPGKTQLLFRLLNHYQNDIRKYLNAKYHSEFDPKKRAKKMYKLRSKIAHELNLGSTTRSEFSETYHIAKVCATTIIKAIINS